MRFAQSVDMDALYPLHYPLLVLAMCMRAIPEPRGNDVGPVDGTKNHHDDETRFALINPELPLLESLAAWMKCKFDLLGNRPWSAVPGSRRQSP